MAMSPEIASMSDGNALHATLIRIADALERLAPPPPARPDLGAAACFSWHGSEARLLPVPWAKSLDVSLLQGIDRQRDTLLGNTKRFASGLPANNALLWGVRGMGKSALVKAVHAHLRAEHPDLILIEITRDEIASLGSLLNLIRGVPERIILFCDDLSFEKDESNYKSLKAVLEGGVEGRPENVLFYATSNRRHLMPREMAENEAKAAIHASEGVEESVSLSDRFGLWLGFHHCDQDTYHAMVRGYAARYGFPLDEETLLYQARQWAMGRGNRSGRVAWQFICDLAGQHGITLD